MDSNNLSNHVDYLSKCIEKVNVTGVTFMVRLFVGEFGGVLCTASHSFFEGVPCRLRHDEFLIKVLQIAGLAKYLLS